MAGPLSARCLYRSWRALCFLRLHRAAGKVCALTHYADGYCMKRGPYGARCNARRGHAVREHFIWGGHPLWGPVFKIPFE